MTSHRMGRIAFALSAVFAVTLISLLSLLGAGLLKTEDANLVYELINGIAPYVAMSLVQALVYCLIGICFRFIAKKGGENLGDARKRLSFYEEIYKRSDYKDGASERVKKLVFRRNLLDVLSCQALSFGLVAILDYLLFFCNYSAEDIALTAERMIYFVLPIAFVGIGLYTVGLICSDAVSFAALQHIEGDFAKKEKSVSKPKEKKASFKGEAFSKFRRKSNLFRILKSVMLGLIFGFALGGLWLILSKLAIIPFEPITAVFEGVGAALIAGGLTFLLGGRSDKALAEELDSLFDLEERAQTMIAYSNESGEMTNLQRQDAERAISEIPLKSYKFKKLWLYICAVLLSAAVLAVGFAFKDMRDYLPPVEEIPFELTELQEAGVLELIKYVESSEMEKEFSTPIADELRDLLSVLRETDTQNDMRAALAKSMAVIMDITYKSSTSTEMLNALRNTGNVYYRHLAKALDTSAQGRADWGDFAENITEYKEILLEDKDKLKSAIEGMNGGLATLLSVSGVCADDEIYLAIEQLFNDEQCGFALLLQKIDSLSDKEAKLALDEIFNTHGDEIFSAISLNKVNASSGEYVMTRLGSLFLVPVPEFERPEFFKNNASVDGGSDGGEEKDPENSENAGGVGSGASYGSDDLVLDPLTGELVRYGDLIDKYNAIMYERLEGDFYTEEQKAAIRKYFELLYSGLEKKEGK